LGEILDKVAASFAATDPVIERPKMYFFYDPHLKRIYESEFFDGDEKIGVPPDFGPFVYQPSESSVRISNMNRNRVFGKSYGGVFFDGKVVPGEVYVFQNDLLTGNWRRLSTKRQFGFFAITVFPLRKVFENQPLGRQRSLPQKLKPPMRIRGSARCRNCRITSACHTEQTNCPTTHDLLRTPRLDMQVLCKFFSVG